MLSRQLRRCIRSLPSASTVYRPRASLCRAPIATSACTRSNSIIEGVQHDPDRKHMSALVPLDYRRGVIRVSGEEAHSFMQGFTTNDIRQLQVGNDQMYTAFLNYKGRVLFEGHISVAAEDRGVLYIDCEKHFVKPAIKHLEKYRLKNDVRFDDVSEDYGVFAILPYGTVGFGSLPTDTLKAARSVIGNGSAYHDKRSMCLGARLIAPKDVEDKLLNEANVEKVDRRVYELSRWLMGCPEGGEVTGSIALEWSLPQLMGISFHKGCYVGQELMARTNFQGQIRKRVLPVLLTDQEKPHAYAWHSGVAEPNIPTVERTNFGLGSDIVHFPSFEEVRLPSLESLPASQSDTSVVTSTGKKAGKLLATIGDSNLAFANLRLRHIKGTLSVHSVSESPLGGTMDDPLDLLLGESEGTSVRPVIPPFWGEIAAAVVEQSQHQE
eukprot:gb/GECG01015973.1/.p1 GENE.gb/GECG01015973.1/~~gb/GECG01015973.1/.p1  ORF type:complete len:438 (+),score=37.77 gb/GECG01015973.1/:1-1314(+)